MIERPLVSVVVNNYNYGRFLAAAIDSALAQTYTPLEVVVVDDGSTDDSREVIAGYADRVRAVVKENAGQGSAFNAGFAACSGQVVIFLDADDTLLPTAAARAVDSFEPGVAKAYWQLLEMDTDGSLLGGTIPRAPLPEGEFREQLLRLGPIACIEAPTSGNAWSRCFLERVLPMPEADFRINADCYLSTLAPLYGDVSTVAEPQSRYRVHGNNSYVVMPVGEKSQRQLTMYRNRCDLVVRHGRALGLDVDQSLWKEGNDYRDYLERITTVSREIEAVVAAGGQFILVDDGLWGDERGATEPVSGRTALPFLERNGIYHGRPLDDDTAISELERLRTERRPQFLIVVWLAFWWLEYYSGFASYLRASFPCVLENDGLVAFDLRA